MKGIKIAAVMMLLGLCICGSAMAAMTYVAANPSTNTQAVLGGTWYTTGSDSTTDNLWTYEAWGDYTLGGHLLIADGPTETCPEIQTTVSGLANGTYDVYLVFYAYPGESWEVQAGLSAGSLTTYSLSSSDITVLNVDSGVDQVQAYIGTVTGTSFTVYLENMTSGPGDLRSWYNGIGYQPAYSTVTSPNPGYLDVNALTTQPSTVGAGKWWTSPPDSATDNLWTNEYWGEYTIGGTLLFSQGGGYENSPELQTSVSGLTNQEYDVYGIYYDNPTSIDHWRINFGLSPGSLTTFDKTNGTLLNNDSGCEQRMASLGSVTGTSITVYTDDVVPGDGYDDRSWFDGIAYAPHGTTNYTYVDATPADTEAYGYPWLTDGTDSGTDNLWTYEYWGNDTIGSSLLIGDGPTESCPELMTTVPGLTSGAKYNVYGVFYTNSASTWETKLGLGAGSLTTYSRTSPTYYNGSPQAELLNNDSGAEQRRVYLGQTNGPTINVYSDNVPSGSGDLRSWLDGIGYQPRQRDVMSLYMDGFLVDGPGWPFQADRLRMNFTGVTLTDMETMQNQALAEGITVLGYNGFPPTADLNVSDCQAMVNAASVTGIRILPWLECSMGSSFNLTQSKYMLEQFITNFMDQAPMYRVNGQMAIILDDPDVIGSTNLADLMNGVQADMPALFARCLFIARLSTYSGQTVASLQSNFLSQGFEGFLDMFGNTNTSTLLRPAVDGYVPDGQGVVGAAVINNGYYWRVEYGQCGYTPDPSTTNLRSNWVSTMTQPVELIHLQSWNDYSENEQFQPSEFEGLVRGQVTQYYTALMNGQSPTTYTDYHCFYNFHRALVLGEGMQIEMLNLPNSMPNYYAVCQIQSPSGTVLSTLTSPLITASTLQAYNQTVDTATFPLGTRYVTLWGIIQDSNHNQIMKVMVGFVVLEPIINRNLMLISKLITDLPNATESVSQNGSTITLTSNATDQLRDLHLMRSDFIPVTYDATSATHVKVLFAGQGTTNSNGQQVNCPISGQISLTGSGQINAAHVYSPMTTGATTITGNYPATSITFTSGTGGILYPEGLILDLSGTTSTTTLSITVNGYNYQMTMSQLGVQEQSFAQASPSWTSIVTAGFTDEDPSLYPSTGPATLTYNTSAMYRDGLSKVWWRPPVEVMFARAMNENRQWLDSTPIVVPCCSTTSTVYGYNLDTTTGSRFQTEYYNGEQLIADWNFANVNPTGSVPTGSGYHYPAILGGDGDLSVPYPRFFSIPNDNPSLSYDSGAGQQVAVFNGTSNFVYCPVSTVPSNASFTLTMKVKPGRVNVLQSLFSDKRFFTGATAAAGVTGVYILANGKVEVQLYGGRTWPALDSSIALSANTWYTIEVEYDLSTLRIYINGTQRGSKSIATTVMPESQNPTIGAEENPVDSFDNYFQGSIAYVQLSA